MTFSTLADVSGAGTCFDMGPDVAGPDLESTACFSTAIDVVCSAKGFVGVAVVDTNGLVLLPAVCDAGTLLAGPFVAAIATGFLSEDEGKP